MESLKQKILAEGQVLGEDILKVDGFLNHQIDVKFMEEIGKEFRKRFADAEVTRILTVESSGIAIACEAAKFFDYVPVVFAKKATPNTMAEGCYSAEARSFTKGTVSNLRVAKRFLQPGDKVLIVDDFLASGEASIALAKMVRKAGAEVVGVGTVIEKQFQGGSAKLRDMGCRVESLAVIKKFENGSILFE
ncbi:xanthine phosphoribosyltransferase [Aminipila luticellarii]|mgnify:CR=1 FL=1|uniref:Xanthine phosphoribosyltransferase n=1 Tax=Aminipila luticellarii TaxID=2507160 RepID=A0A410PSV0_9FIRM|nr:xanthine phosphoribosyltransferase [Aminipila luticellarii]QAT42042.1 xanthine phosphoribosyltransferase [Aminipila luticellarii]